MPFLSPDPSTEATSVAHLTQRIAALEADNIRLRAAVIQRESALAFARQEQHALAESIPGLQRRAALARHVDVLAERVSSLLRERPNHAVSPSRLESRQ